MSVLDKIVSRGRARRWQDRSEQQEYAPREALWWALYLIVTGLHTRHYVATMSATSPFPQARLAPSRLLARLLTSSPACLGTRPTCS